MQPDTVNTRAGGKSGAGWCLRAQTHKVNENDFPRPDSSLFSLEIRHIKSKACTKKEKFFIEIYNSNCSRELQIK